MTGLAMSTDALRLAVGTENGTLGVLAIPTHAYTTLLRSHCGAVNAVAVDPNRWGGWVGGGREGGRQKGTVVLIRVMEQLGGARWAPGWKSGGERSEAGSARSWHTNVDIACGRLPAYTCAERERNGP